MIYILSHEDRPEHQQESRCKGIGVQAGRADFEGVVEQGQHEIHQHLVVELKPVVDLLLVLQLGAQVEGCYALKSESQQHDADVVDLVDPINIGQCHPIHEQNRLGHSASRAIVMVVESEGDEVAEGGEHEEARNHLDGDVVLLGGGFS